MAAPNLRVAAVFWEDTLRHQFLPAPYIKCAPPPFDSLESFALFIERNFGAPELRAAAAERRAFDAHFNARYGNIGAGIGARYPGHTSAFCTGMQRNTSLMLHVAQRFLVYAPLVPTYLTLVHSPMPTVLDSGFIAGPLAHGCLPMTGDDFEAQERFQQWCSEYMDRHQESMKAIAFLKHAAEHAADSTRALFNALPGLRGVVQAAGSASNPFLEETVSRATLPYRGRDRFNEEAMARYEPLWRTAWATHRATLLKMVAAGNADTRANDGFNLIVGYAPPVFT